KASGARALRAHDGVSVPVPDFSDAFQNRIRILGRHILLRETQKNASGQPAPGGKTIFRLHDVETGKDLWSRDFTPNALRLESEDSHLLAVVEPTNDGQLTVIDLNTQQELLSAKIQPEHLNKVPDGGGHLLRDNDQFYVALNKPLEQQVGVNIW